MRHGIGGTWWICFLGELSPLLLPGPFVLEPSFYHAASKKELGPRQGMCEIFGAQSGAAVLRKTGAV